MLIPDMPWGLRLLLCMLACYRLAKLFAEDDGPFFIFKRLRHWLREEAYYEMLAHGIDSNSEEDKDNWFGHWHNLNEGLGCAYCVGLWVSFPLFLLWIFPTTIGDGFLFFISISAMQAFLHGLKK